MNKSNLIILTFIITTIYDIILQNLSKNYEILPQIIKDNFSFIKLLQPYFKYHTFLSAAILAGFIGATTQFIIINIYKFPTKLTNIKQIGLFLLVTFIISGLYGYGMILSDLFPHLEKHYYDKLSSVDDFIQNGVSGLIVQITILIYVLWMKKF